MTKKHFIALADAIREHNRLAKYDNRVVPFNEAHIGQLAAFCKRDNSNFNRERWLSYVAGECGPNGGTIK